MTYADGTAGHSGSSTSLERARSEASSGRDRQRRSQVLLILSTQGVVGVTWAEIAARLQCHHGAASAVLSNMHKEGAVVRLTQRRNRCHIYVLPEYVMGRAFEPFGGKNTTTLNAELVRLRAVEDSLYRWREVDRLYPFTDQWWDVTYRLRDVADALPPRREE